MAVFSCFEQIFTFLERYNFTISEDSPLDKEVAVDPEMIGKVYESLVNVSAETGERGDAGIFYTPRTEIDLMCRLSLVDHLANCLGDQHKDLLYEVIFAFEPDEKNDADKAIAKINLSKNLYDRLNEIKVLDPACGSGSFLVGMLYILNDLQTRLADQLNIDESPYERKKRIIGKSLYGVDVMDWACHTAELRLWLALIIDLEMNREDLHIRNEPLLPHFTFNIRCGDSLVQEVGGLNMAQVRGSFDIPPDLKTRITKLKNEKLKYYNNDPDCQFRSPENAKEEERRLFRDILNARQHTIQEQMKSLRRKIEGDEATQIQLLEVDRKENSRQLELENFRMREQIDVLNNQLEQIKEAFSTLKTVQDVPFVWDIAFVEIFGGENPGFDIVIGNPPYVRQENISDPHLPREEVTTENKKVYKAKLARSVYQAFPHFFGYNASKDTVIHKIGLKSDLYIYFYFHGLSLLNSNGAFCFITSNSWLDVGYGADLQEFLLNHCHIKMILDNQVKRSFASADVNTIIALFSAPDESHASGLDRIGKFVMFKVPFEHVLSPVIFEEIEAEKKNRLSTPEYRVHPISQKILLTDGSEKLVADDSEESALKTKGRKVEAAPLVKVAKYIGNKWGGKYLRAPDIYWTILEKGRGKLVRLDKIATVRPGCYSGINDFFYLSKDSAKNWGIEQECLRPLIRTPREINKSYITKNDINHYVFYCPFDKNKMKQRGLRAALEYISWGEKQVTRKRQKTPARIPWPQTETVRHRVPGWWAIPLKNVDPTQNFLLYVIGERFLAPLSDISLVSDRCFHRIFVSSDLVHPFAISINSTLTFLFISLFGRSNLGQGAQKYETSDAKKLQILNPSFLINFSGLDQTIKSFGYQEVLPIGLEVQRKKRQPLDNLIFDVLGFTKGEREAVYEAVINLVEGRLKKADSL